MGKRIEFLFLFLATFIERHKRHIGLGTIIGFFVTLFILQIYPLYNQIFGVKEERIGLIGQYTENTIPLIIKNQISLGLTSLTQSGEASPSLALSWNMEPDGLKYTFHLKPNYYWHDQTKFTSKDINYKLKNVTFTPLDENTITVTLKEDNQFSPLPVILSQPLFKNNLVGLGNYKVSRIKYNGDYISELTLHPLKSTLAPIKYRFYPNKDEAILAFKLGEINIIENLSDASEFKNWQNLKITEVNMFDRFVGIFLNLRDQNFKEKEIRQGVNYAVPRFDKFEKAYTPISPLSWAYSSKIRLYRYDPDIAKKILSKSPMSSSSSELTISTYSSLVDIAQTVADAWNKIGIKTKIKVEASIPADYEVFILTLAIPSDPDQYQYWQSTQDITNISHYSNLKIDKLLEDGRKTSDQEKRKKIYADFQRYLVDDSPVIFLYHPKQYIVERK